MADLTQGRHLKYWSPTQIKLYTSGSGTDAGLAWLDDAIGIDIRIQDQKIPHFGYADHLFRRVSHGRTMISGNLYIHFRYPNYLTHAIDNQRKALKPIITDTPQFGEGLDSIPYYPRGTGRPAVTRENLEIVSTQDKVNALKTLLLDDFETFTVASRDFKTAITGVGHQKSAQEVVGFPTERPAERQTNTDNGLRILIQYGDGTYDKVSSFTQALEEVYFVGTSHTITVGDGSGDRSVYEVYSFIARNLSAVAPLD